MKTRIQLIRIVYPLLFLAGECFMLLEYSFHPDFSSMQPIFFFINYLFVFFMILVLAGLFNSIKATIIVSNLLFGIWGAANTFLTDFRNQPILLSDISSIGTAAEMASQYHLYFTAPLVTILVIGIAVMLLALFMPATTIFHTWKGKIGVRLLSLGLLGGLSSFVLYSSAMSNTPVSFWDPVSIFQEYGTVYATFLYANRIHVSKPAGYSASNVEQLVEDLPDVKTTTVKPNIIAIMNESFTDFSFMNDYTTNVPVLEFYHSLTENTIKGSIMVSCFGSGTSKTEYEFLTGNSMSFFHSSVTPYMVYFKQDQDSLVSTLNAEGYTTIAMHPSNPNNWNRSNVYEHLGFDQFLSIEDFSGTARLRKLATDQVCYDKIIELYEEKGEDPLFIFNITIQNHGGYSIDDYDGGVTINSGDYADANQYISLLRESDLAFKNLIEYFEEASEPTLIILFGDHWPTLDTGFYEELSGMTNEEMELDTYMQYYKTPFLIWANYDIEEQSDVQTSPNYLSSMLLKQTDLQMTKYNQYLLDLQKKIPAISLYGYYDSDYIYHENYNEVADDYESYLQYCWMQYNNMFDTKNKLKTVFEIDNKEDS